MSARLGMATQTVRQQATPTPFELFQRMLPVIRHPRCINCHGGVDPYSGRGHEPGAIDTNQAHSASQQCSECHSAVEGWGLPATSHFWTGKTDRELCGIFAEFAMQQGHVRVIENHLRTDDLIKDGFVGDAGGQRMHPDPPRMSQTEFVDHARDWLEQGQAACELLGTIKLEESVSAKDSASIGPIRRHMRIDGTRTVILTNHDGKYDANIKTDYTLVEVDSQMVDGPSGPCSIVTTRNERQAGTTTGAASVTIKDTIFFFGTTPPQTDYRIDVALPPETTQKNELRTTRDNCGLPIPFPPARETSSNTWGRAFFVLEGHLQDPKTDGRVGSCDRDWKSTDINTREFEESGQPCLRFKNMGNSWYLGLMERTLPQTFHDLKPIPYHLRASWNLKYVRR